MSEPTATATQRAEADGLASTIIASMNIENGERMCGYFLALIVSRDAMERERNAWCKAGGRLYVFSDHIRWCQSNEPFGFGREQKACDCCHQAACDDYDALDKGEAPAEEKT